MKPLTLVLPCLAALAVIATAAWGIERQLQPQKHGEAVYRGTQPLTGHLRGHDEPLPTIASRCINCHEGNGATGPVLNATTLTQVMARRGGPPTRYDAASLCRVLQEGIDPAWIQLPRDMPLYTADAGTCEDLWAYLRSRP